jgi:hypothetical protein
VPEREHETPGGSAGAEPGGDADAVDAVDTADTVDTAPVGEPVAERAPESAEDAAAMLAMLDAERARVLRAILPDPRIIYGVWGIAWLVGFVLMWFAVTGTEPLDVPVAAAGIVFGGCITGAIVITVVHIVQRAAGVRGESNRVGALYGWSWMLAMVALTVILNASYAHGLPEELGRLLWPVLSGLVVGTLYLAGGAIWQDLLQYRLGVWILVASAAGAVAGYPGVHLVMGLGGGGGFLVAAAYYAVRGRGVAA